jgi:hypothetical protein
MDLIDPLYEEIYRQGVKITGNTALRKTFALNALVSVDNALWLLYAKEHNIRDFDQLIPDTFKKTFPEKHEKVAAIPLISYNVKPSEILAEAHRQDVKHDLEDCQSCHRSFSALLLCRPDCQPGVGGVEQEHRSAFEVLPRNR